MDLIQEFASGNPNEKLMQLILDEEELSWQKIIYDLVKKDHMDPWNINVSILTANFIDLVRELASMDFRISGKIVLASALLLKLKSNKLMDEDMALLDNLISSTEQDDYEDFFGFEMEQMFPEAKPEKPEYPKIFPRTPQPRQRKVSVYDLVTALEKALDVSVRKQTRALDRVAVGPDVKIPDKKIDISEAMNGLLQRIAGECDTKQRITFTKLAPSQTREDKVYTFIPLLQLTNELRIDLEQPTHFEEIHIALLDATPVEYSESEPAQV